MNKIELLAPAGDLERLKTAVRYGADAVYIGGKRFSLRSRASNFGLEEIAEGVVFAKEYGARIHVTVNIVPHEDDLQGLEDYLISLENIGVAAVIAASPYIIQTAKRVAPKLEVHLSTQMSSLNRETVEYYRQLGADRVVLGRECSLQEVISLAQASKLPLEAFIHGGMCVNYSGRCTLSNAMTWRDANRGGCAQSCRWQYHLYEGNQELSSDTLFSMSSKDLMAAEAIEPMKKAGIASLKIEGRMKSAYYIATVVRAYRQLIDELEETGTVSEKRLLNTKEELMRAENRPTCTGFYYGEPDEDSHLYQQDTTYVTHDFVGVVLSYHQETNTAQVEIRNRLLVGEWLEVIGPHRETAVFQANYIQDEEGQSVDVANRPMQIVSLPSPLELKPYDLIRRGRKL